MVKELTRAVVGISMHRRDDEASVETDANATAGDRPLERATDVVADHLATGDTLLQLLDDREGILRPEKEASYVSFNGNSGTKPLTTRHS